MSLLQNYLSPQAYRQLKIERLKRRAGDYAAIWQPNPDHPDGRPNPQRLAVESQADILGYGGAAGGGKTDLLLGLAATQHRHSAIFRRVIPSLRGIIERSRQLFNPTGAEHGKDSFNESLHRWSLDNGRRIVELEACQFEKDKEKQRGRPRDFYGFDEVTEYSLTMIQFITAWLRSTDLNQRCRIVLTFNPPLDDAGSWVIDYFLPWLAYLFPDKFQHPKPAAPGELRWYATVDGKEVERPDGQRFDHNGEEIRPLSRTFIPAKLQDNPHLARTNYGAIIDSLPEPLRSQLKHGDFAATTKGNPWQVIPSAWVRLAQKRWLDAERPSLSLSAVGVDVARGGQDRLAIAKRYGNWFDEVVTHAGANVEDGPAAAELVRQTLGKEQPSYINVDVIGVGTSAYDSLKVMYPTTPVNAAAHSDHKDRSGKLKMRNKRAEYYWKFREALDPEHGDEIALPPGNEVLADLCAATYKATTAGIQIEDKEEIKKRINRSPDVGEAILLAHLNDALEGQLFF